MITAQLKGGLGNMMFQIAATYALALDNNDTSALIHQTPINQGNPSLTYVENILSRVKFVDKLNLISTYHEPNYHFQKLPYKDGLRLNGYFQSERYFIHRDKEVRDLFRPTEEIIKYIQAKHPFILNKKTVGVHVRKGDYLNNPNIHPTCSEQYYKDAIKNFPDHSIIMFSDDTEWCKKVFGESVQVITGEPDWIDLYLMSMSKHNIIANSSFSWWAAWLNSNPHKKVIAPKTWFGKNARHDTKDLYCEGWKII